MARAALYDLGNGFLSHSYAKTEAGFWLAAEPAQLLAQDATDEAIGTALLKALTRKQPVRATPSRNDYLDIGDPLLTSVGLRSWTDVQRRAKMCAVEIRGEGLRFVPTVNERRDGARAFYDLEDQALECSEAMPGPVGAAARVAIARARLV